jgi:hypothetical protein
MDQANNDYDQCLDTFCAMLSQERQAYLVNDTLSIVAREQQENVNPLLSNEARSSSSSPPVDATCRYLMASWCNDLCDFCHYSRDLAAMTMINVDRYTNTPEGFPTLFDRERYQLCVMAAFYMSAKITQAEALDPKSVALLSKGKLTKDDIEAMEFDMLMALKWRVNPPTPTIFAEYMFDLVPGHVIDGESKAQLLDMTKVQLEASTTDCDLCLHRPSRLAFGAVLNALECLDTKFAVKFESTMLSMVMTDLLDITEILNIRTGLLVLVSNQTGPAGLPEPWQELLIQQKRSSSTTSVKATSIKRKQITESGTPTSSSRTLSSSPRSIVSSFLV